MTAVWWGGALGLMLACGLLLVWVGLPRHRQVSLADRVEPYLDRAPRRSRLLALDDPQPWRLTHLLRPLTARLARGLDVREPVLVCTSTRSGSPTDPSPDELRGADCVLDVGHILERAPRVGRGRLDSEPSPLCGITTSGGSSGGCVLAFGASGCWVMGT